MRYTTVTGEFHIHYPDAPRQGPQPDGDTVTFKPDDPSLIRSLERFGNRDPDFNRRGMLGLRFEAIDALETHFRESHQDLELAYQARDFVLSHLGFEDVAFFEENLNVIESVGNNPQRGYILANGIDSNGRVLAFVYPGDQPQSNGGPTFLDQARMFESVNLAVLGAGLAYAAIYTSLPVDLAGALRSKAEAVRLEQTGIFASEDLNTQRTAQVRGLDELESMAIWPKLFRRLVSFFSSGFSDLNDFDAWLRADPTNRDDRLLLPNGELGNMHDVAIVEDGAMRLQWEPERVTILPDNA